jgi:hypothetical protein
MYLPAYSLPVQNFIASSTWTLDAILALPDTRGDDGQGIYGNFPTGGPSRPNIGCEAYVGSAQVLHRRNYHGAQSHLGISQKYSSVYELPIKLRGSLHYRDTCRPGVLNNFRKLVRFPKSVEMGWNHVLESVNMILLGSYNDSGRYHKWSSKASYDLVSEIRSSLELPAVPWKGLNAAWPLYQGIPCSSRFRASPCANKACGNMTYPKGKIPEGQSRCPRVLYNPLDPLGPYICPACDNYRCKFKTLPSKAWCDAVAERIRRRSVVGKDAQCACCSRLESELPWKRVELKGGRMTQYKVSFALHPLTAGEDKVYCMACHRWASKHGRFKTQDELKGSEPVYKSRTGESRKIKADLRKKGLPIVCVNCNVVETEKMRYKHTVVEGKVHCRNCYQKIQKERSRR